MNILFIVPGSGDSFYCGNCFRDNLYAGALKNAGNNVVIMPLYLPINQGKFKANTPLFFPATSYYIAQKYFQNTRLPKWIKRITESKTLLNMAASFSGTTSAKGLEDMTLSMINGNNPAFLEEVEHIINWIKKTGKPDIIHLSSSLLIGIAKELKKQLNIPIVCSLLDEEVWIETLDNTYINKAWQGIENNLVHIDRFVTSSNYYRESIQQRMPKINNIDVVYPGIDKEKYELSNIQEYPTIGFFYRMNKDNGLDILAKAFVELKKRNSIPNLRLKIGGGYTSHDKKFIAEIRSILKKYKNDVEIIESYTVESHHHFYASISLISVPITYNEGLGLYLCEAFAVGKPAVQASTGAFPEIVENAGLLYNPNNYLQLADAIEKLLCNKDLYLQTVSEAKKIFEKKYNEKLAAQKLLEIYNNISEK